MLAKPINANASTPVRDNTASRLSPATPSAALVAPCAAPRRTVSSASSAAVRIGSSGAATIATITSRWRCASNQSVNVFTVAPLRPRRAG